MLTKLLRIISRLAVGALFIFSGFVKAIDPLGSTYKFQDYFHAFGIDWLAPLALSIAIFLSTLEMVIGFIMVMGIRIRQTSWVLFIVMSFFTLLTFFIALTNPVTDCGCFGDALVLTNWQTFWKNVIFMVPTVFIFYQRRWFRPLYNVRYEKALVVIFIFASIGLSLYSYRNLPLMDFRPYKIGTHIPSKMKIPEGAPVDEYETILVYEKYGEQKEFTMDNYPWQDTTWKWVETRQELIKKGYRPPIHDFSLTTLDGFDITQDVLQDSGYTFLLVAYDLKKAGKDLLESVNDLAIKTKEDGHRFVATTASPLSELEEMMESANLNYDLHLSDEITLKTIVRSNPGLLLLKEGVILNKWHFSNFPHYNQFNDSYLGGSLALLRESIESQKVWIFFLLIGVMLFFYHRISRKY
ncbi:MAG: DoxX family protein [Bacteroidetes bacterium]|jgi:uncharacterized membrane protein YphA (DoxX/SURF4 family)|nr:DoxX family protein [Bacteroidota bacterium]